MNTVHTAVKAEPSLALSLLCLFRYKPARQVGTVHENSARLRAHGVQRCVHLPYVPPAGFCLSRRARPRAAWRGASDSRHEDCFGPQSELTSLALAVSSPCRVFSVAGPQPGSIWGSFSVQLPPFWVFDPHAPAPSAPSNLGLHFLKLEHPRVLL